MSKKRYFDTKFWSDNFVVDELNPLDRYVFMYLMLNERTNIVGAYELPLKTAANETGIEKDELARMIARLRPKVMYVDSWIVIANTIKHQNYHSPKMVTGILAELDKVPKQLYKYINFPDDFAPEQRSKYEGIGTVSKVNDTVSIRYAYDTNNRDLNRDLDLNRDRDIKEDTSYLPTAKKPILTVNEEIIAIPERVSSKTIDGMFEYWNSMVGYNITSRVKQNREYCGKLVKEYSKQEIASMIQAAAVASEDQYAPGVSDFMDLYRKWDKLKLWGKKKGIRSASAEF